MNSTLLHCLFEFRTYEQTLEDDSVQKEEIYRELYIAIDRLPEREREVLLLALEGKSNQEIAEQLELSVLTIKTHKKNAYNRLRERLGSFILLLFLHEKNILS